jgi:hypothetical protein
LHHGRVRLERDTFGLTVFDNGGLLTPWVELGSVGFRPGGWITHFNLVDCWGDLGVVFHLFQVPNAAVMFST